MLDYKSINSKFVTYWNAKEYASFMGSRDHFKKTLEARTNGILKSSNKRL